MDLRNFLKNIFTYLFIWLRWVLVMVGKLLVSMWDLVLRPGIEPRSSALGAESLSHWTTKEFPHTFLNPHFDNTCIEYDFPNNDKNSI